MWSVAIGPWTLDATKDWWYEVLTNKELKKGYVEFCDMTQVTSVAITADDLPELSSLIELGPHKLPRKTAVLARRDDVWRVNMQIEKLLTSLDTTIVVFFDRLTACAWLGLSHDMTDKVAHTLP